jgi:hypothetical protein
MEKFSIFDRHGTYKEVLEPFIASGLVDYRYFPMVFSPMQYNYIDQLYAMEVCRWTHIESSHWLINHDIDEWMNFPNLTLIPHFPSSCASVYRENGLAYIRMEYPSSTVSDAFSQNLTNCNSTLDYYYVHRLQNRDPLNHWFQWRFRIHTVSNTVPNFRCHPTFARTQFGLNFTAFMGRPCDMSFLPSYYLGAINYTAAIIPNYRTKFFFRSVSLGVWHIHRFESSLGIRFVEDIRYFHLQHFHLPPDVNVTNEAALERFWSDIPYIHVNNTAFVIRAWIEQLADRPSLHNQIHYN